MAQKHGVYVFPSDCTDFTTTGLVGDLRPTQAVFREEKNGICEVEIHLTYDQYNRWREAAKVGNILKCEVPTRVPPVIDDDAYASEVQTYTN